MQSRRDLASGLQRALAAAIASGYARLAGAPLLGTAFLPPRPRLGNCLGGYSLMVRSRFAEWRRLGSC